MKFINKLRGELGLYKPKDTYENDILQYTTVINVLGEFIKVRNCSQYEYDNVLNIYDDVIYYINVASNDGKEHFKIIPSYDLWAQEQLEDIETFFNNRHPMVYKNFCSEREWLAKLPNKMPKEEEV